MTTNPERKAWLEETVADVLGVDVAEIRGPHRTNRASEAKHVIWWLLSEHEGWAKADIGRMFDQHHSTVHHGVQKVERRIRIDRDFRITTATIASRYFAWRSGEVEAAELVTRPDEMLALARSMLAMGEQLVRIASELIDHIEGRAAQPAAVLTRGRA